MNSGNSWLDQAARAPLPEVIEALGLQHHKRSFGPCPSCGAEVREKNRRRHPMGMTLDREGWRCFPCGETGNVISLVALALTGSKNPGRGQWGPIRQWFAGYGWCQSATGQAVSPVKARIRPKKTSNDSENEMARQRFLESVQGFWNNALMSLGDDHGTCRRAIEWLEKERGFPKDHIANIIDQDLFRILDPRRSCPSWAYFGRNSWSKGGYRLIFPAYNKEGKLSSLRARSLDRQKVPKSVAPKGEGVVATARACVLANDLGRSLLESGQKPQWWPSNQALKAVILEGEPDFLSWAGRDSDAVETPLAVFGIWSGAWTADIGKRLPSGTRVTIRTDRDKAGDEYARRIFETISNHCTVFRAKENQ